MLECAGSGHDLGATMTTDPTQPMSPPASAGSGSPELPEQQEPGVAEQSAPTVQEARPSFQQAQPSFQPAQPGFPPARPAFEPPQPGVQPGQQPYVPQQDWPQGGAGNAGMPAPPGTPGGTRQWPAGGHPGYQGGQGVPVRRRRRRGRRWTMTIFGVIVLLILLVIGDRVALAIAENNMADQFVSNGFPVKPSVTIEGFPFLTQLITRDFRKVDISASNVPAGPLTITSAKATLTGMHINSSFKSATADHVTVTLFASFDALAAAGGLNGTGITIAPAGPNLLKITANLGGVLSDTEEAKVTQTGPRQISIQIVNSGSPIGGILSSFGSYSFSLPNGVPPSLRITGVFLNSQGLTITAAADHANLSQPSS
jgi:LmeA-like phospholipid-binding